MEEKRRAWDGVPYTQQQFVQYYGDKANEYWNKAAAVSKQDPAGHSRNPGGSTVKSCRARRKFACRARRRFGASAEIQAASELVAQSTAEIEGDATEHVVFCLMASKLTHLTNEASVLFLCQNQERVAGQSYLHTITDVSGSTEALNDLYIHPCRWVLRWIPTSLDPWIRDLVRHMLRKCFSIWRAAKFVFPKL